MPISQLTSKDRQRNQSVSGAGVSSAHRQVLCAQRVHVGHRKSPRSLNLGCSGGSVVKNPPVNAGYLGSIPGRSPGEGNGNPLQSSCLENPVDREAWQATIQGVLKSRT